MKKVIIISILVILATSVLVFVPMYDGKVYCGINPDKPCFNQKLNLIEYVKYKNQPELLKECPDEMIVNKMPSVTGELGNTYYIKDGVRREIQEYDYDWVQSNCSVPVQEVY